MTALEFDRFLNTSPNLLVAPAGYGKTHTIAKSVDVLQKAGEENSVLVLTHTNAGIASIREKIKKESVRLRNVTICTIAGFLQKIVHSLSKVPLQQGNDSNDFYSKLYASALELFQENNSILKIAIESSYDHIFVDEFQDCNKQQYEIVKIISRWDIRVHLLLDPLQTIFNFEVDHPDYLAFEKRCRTSNPNKVFQLDIPYRWRNVNSPLEQYVPQWRTTIQDALNQGAKSIDLRRLPGVMYFSGTFADALNKINTYLRKAGNVLVLHSHYKKNNIQARGKICLGSGYRLRMMESIDHSDFYDVAAAIDLSIQNNDSVEAIVYSILQKSGASTNNLEKWIKPNHLVSKQSDEDKALASILSVAVSRQPKEQAIIDSIGVVTKRIGLPIQRVDFLSDILSAISSTMASGHTVLEEVTRKRNLARVQGRKLYGKVIGTTLLTKGLEADTVILIKPSELFNDEDGLKHLYVALTRAVKEIVLIDY